MWIFIYGILEVNSQKGHFGTKIKIHKEELFSMLLNNTTNNNSSVSRDFTFFFKYTHF